MWCCASGVGGATCVATGVRGAACVATMGQGSRLRRYSSRGSRLCCYRSRGSRLCRYRSRYRSRGGCLLWCHWLCFRSRGGRLLSGHLLCCRARSRGRLSGRRIWCFGRKCNSVGLWIAALPSLPRLLLLAAAESPPRLSKLGPALLQPAAWPPTVLRLVVRFAGPQKRSEKLAWLVRNYFGVCLGFPCCHCSESTAAGSRKVQCRASVLLALLQASQLPKPLALLLRGLTPQRLQRSGALLLLLPESTPLQAGPLAVLQESREPLALLQGSGAAGFGSHAGAGFDTPAAQYDVPKYGLSYHEALCFFKGV